MRFRGIEPRDEKSLWIEPQQGKHRAYVCETSTGVYVRMCSDCKYKAIPTTNQIAALREHLKAKKPAD